VSKNAVDGRDDVKVVAATRLHTGDGVGKRGVVAVSSGFQTPKEHPRDTSARTRKLSVLPSITHTK